VAPGGGQAARRTVRTARALDGGPPRLRPRAAGRGHSTQPRRSKGPPDRLKDFLARLMLGVIARSVLLRNGCMVGRHSQLLRDLELQIALKSLGNETRRAPVEALRR
jgi:hypothetical protein